jgi:hypothetical protein
MRTAKNTLMPYGARVNTLGRIARTFRTQPLTFTKEARHIAEALSLRKAVSDMARYIDADALMEKIRKCEFELTGRGIVYPAGDVQSAIYWQPTADVAPRAEVAREIFEELERYIINHCYLADDDVDAIWKHIDKLKKKYTEETP